MQDDHKDAENPRTIWPPRASGQHKADQPIGQEKSGLIKKPLINQKTLPLPKLFNQFKEIFFLSLRTAVTCVLMSLPFLVNSWAALLPPEMMMVRFRIGVYHCATVTTTLGNTVQLICYYLYGIFIAIGYIVCVATAIQGKPSNDLEWWFVALSAVGYYIFVLTLNFPMLARIMAFCLAGESILKILNPSSELDFRLFNGNTPMAWCQVAGIMWAAAFALLTVLFPSPLTARKKVKIMQATNAARICTLYKDALVLFSNRAHSFVLHRWNGEIDILNQQIQDTNGFIDLAFWEGFDILSFGKSRSALKEKQKLIEKSYTFLCALKLPLANETYTHLHQYEMKVLNKPLWQLFHEVNTMLYEVVTDDVTFESFNIMVSDLKETHSTLCQLSNELADDFARKGGQEFHEDLLGVHSFLFIASSYCKEVWNADTIMDPPRLTLYTVTEFVGFLMPPITRLHATFVAHNLLAFFLASIVEIWFLRYTSGYTIMTIALLMNTHFGSVINVSIERIAAVCIPAAFSMLCKRYLYYCDVKYRVILGTLLFIFIFSSRLVVFVARQRKDLLFLLIAYGTDAFIGPCQDCVDMNSIRLQGFDTIVNLLMGIMLLLLSNILIPPPSASSLAAKNLVQSLESTEAAWNSYFQNEDREEIEGTIALITPKLRNAVMMTAEAAREPRYWKRVWPRGMVEKVTKHIESLRIYLVVISCVAAPRRHFGSVNENWYKVLRRGIPQSEEFRVYRDNIMAQIEDTIMLLQSVFAHESSDRFVMKVNLRSFGVPRSHRNNMMRMMNQYLESQRARGYSYDRHSTKRSSMAFLAFDAATRRLAAIFNVIMEEFI